MVGCTGMASPDWLRRRGSVMGLLAVMRGLLDSASLMSSSDFVLPWWDPMSMVVLDSVEEKDYKVEYKVEGDLVVKVQIGTLVGKDVLSPRWGTVP